MKIFITHPKTKNANEKEVEYFGRVKSLFPNSEVLANLGNDQYNQIDILVCVPFDDGDWSMDSWKLADLISSKGGKIYELLKSSLKEVDHKEIRPLSISTTKARELANFTFMTPEEKTEKAYEQIKRMQELNHRLSELGLSADIKRTEKE